MADAKNDIVLSIRGMSKSFGRNRVLDHIDLDVRRGTVMGLMGENGAGKSTMMKCLFGTYQKDEGKIFLNGKEISFALSQQAVCSFVMEHLDGKVMPQRMAETVFDSTTFQTRMQLFNAWVQMHENQLDQNFMEFGSWRELFAQWCSTDQVKELATRMAAPRTEGNGTTH